MRLFRVTNAHQCPQGLSKVYLLPFLPQGALTVRDWNVAMVSCSLCELVFFFLKPRKTCTTNNLCMRDKKKAASSFLSIPIYPFGDFMISFPFWETLANWLHKYNSQHCAHHTEWFVCIRHRSIFFFFLFVSSFKGFRYWLAIHIWVEIQDRKYALVLQNTSRASCASSCVTTYSIECTKHYVKLIPFFVPSP